MYTKDKSNRITLRLSDEQFAFVKENSEIMDVSPSEFIRILINMTKITSEIAAEKAFEKYKGVSARNEDVKTNIDNIV